jgi:hypothetical protein
MVWLRLLVKSFSVGLRPSPLSPSLGFPSQLEEILERHVDLMCKGCRWLGDDFTVLSIHEVLEQLDATACCVRVAVLLEIQEQDVVLQHVVGERRRVVVDSGSEDFRVSAVWGGHGPRPFLVGPKPSLAHLVSD